MLAWFRFTTMADGRVCPGCESFHGLVAPARLTIGVIPMHPWCRCRWVFVGIFPLPPGDPVPWINVEDEDDDDELTTFEKIKLAVRRLHDQAVKDARAPNR